ncbi:MAG TPA: hypothetical protein DCZ55_10775, partial [Cyanobacteria bacterium UBA11371]|nr:hypothetical protein [Cyanobacteria bacterium UBA11371]
MKYIQKAIAILGITTTLGGIASVACAVPKTSGVLARNETGTQYHRLKALKTPKTAEDWFNRGLERSESGDYQSAIDDFTKVLQLDPNFIEA